MRIARLVDLLPRPLAIRYVQFGRYGLLVLMLLLFVGDGVLRVWFTPASIATDYLLNVAQPYIVPAAGQWLR